VSVELWANDAIVGIQLAPTPDGITQLPGHFSWLPNSPGPHRLQARAIDNNGSVEASEAVWLLVTAEGSSGEVLPHDGGLDFTVPAPTGSGLGYPLIPGELVEGFIDGEETDGEGYGPQIPTPPSPPAADEPVVPAKPWSPSLGGFLPWLFSSEDPPKAPALVGAVDACNVMLSLHDLSVDEMGFRVYRTQMGGGESTDPLLTLGAGADTGWLSVSDNVGFGSIHTYVAEAFNSSGTSNPSNPVTLNSLNAGCAPPEPPPLVTLTPTALTTALPVTNAYCYVSNAGLIWSRLPTTGFLTVGEDGKLINLNSELGQTTLDGLAEPATAKFWDCWGWAEGALTWLGSSTPDTEEQGGISPEVVALEGSLSLEIGSPRVEGVLGSGSSTLDVEMIPAVTLPPEGKIGEFVGIDFGDLIGALDPTATDPQMLAPRLHYSSNTTDCVNNLPGSVKPDFQIPLCHPGDDVSTLDPGDVGDHPHAYLFWDLEDPNNCDHPSDCVDPRSESYLPYSVVESGYRLYELTLDGTSLVKTFGFGEELFIVPPKGPCGTLRMFEVRTFVKLDQPITYESHSPNAIVLFDEPCSPSVPVEIELTFATLTLNNVDDDDTDTGQDGVNDDIEIYGSFSAVPAVGVGDRLWFGLPYIWASPLDTYACQSNESIQPLGAPDHQNNFWTCPLPIQDGDHSLVDFKIICPDSSDPKCQGPGLADLGADAGNINSGNNTAYLTTEQGNDSILVSIDIWDLDSDSDDDPVCVVSAWFSKEPGSNWSTMDGGSWGKLSSGAQGDWVGGYWYLAQGNNGHASCTVWFHIDVIDS
jgi:hypothetical protein